MLSDYVCFYWCFLSRNYTGHSVMILAGAQISLGYLNGLVVLIYLITYLLTYVLLTYLLNQCSTVLLEKLTGFSANQEISRILWNPKFRYRTHKRPTTVPILSQPHPVPTTPSYFLKSHLNIILSFTSWSPQWSLSLRFPHQNLVHTFPFLHTCHMPRPSS